MGFWIGLSVGLVIGLVAGAAAIAAAMGLWAVALEQIKAHSVELAEQLGEPTEPRQRSRTL